MEGLEIEEEGARGVCRVRDVSSQKGVADPGIDGAEQELVPVKGLLYGRVVVHHPSQLDGGEVGRDREPRRSLDVRVTGVGFLDFRGRERDSGGGELVEVVCDGPFGPRVVPDDSRTERRSSRAMPGYGCLSLVRYPLGGLLVVASASITGRKRRYRLL